MLVTSELEHDESLSDSDLVISRAKVLAYDEEGRPIHLALVYDADLVIHDEVSVLIERK